MFFNFRAAKQSGSVPPRGQPLAFGLPGAGITVNADSAYTYSAFWACVKIISETIAYLPWHIMQSGDRRIVASDHPLDRVVYRKPNPEMSAATYKELMLAHALTWGNHYAEIERNRLGDVVALWPIDPENVDVQRDNSGQIVYRVQSQSGSVVTLAPRDVFHLRGPSRDGLIGYSVIQMARESISLGLAAEAFGSSFFGNGAIPGVVIKNTGGAKLKEEGVRNLLATWNKKNRGPRNFNKTEYLDAGMEVERIGVPPGDAQFLETRKFQITEIARWFRIPPHKLADLERSTHTNIEAQNIEFVTDSIMPWISRIECQSDVTLLSDDDYGVYYNKINVNGLLRGDSKSRGEFYQLLAGMGVLSIDEIRSMEDRDAIGGDEGELRIVPMNMTTLGRMVHGENGSGRGMSQNANAALMDACRRMTKLEINRVKRIGEKPDTEANLVQFYSQHARATADAIAPLAGIIADQIGVELTEQQIMQAVGTDIERSADEANHAIKTGRLNALLCSWESRKADRLAQQIINAVQSGGKNDVQAI